MAVPRAPAPPKRKMVTTLAQVQTREIATAERATATGQALYAKRRTWSRTDTARWLNERSPAVLAWLRRRTGNWPAHSKQVGYWLKEYAPRAFDRAHERLAAGADDFARENMLPRETLK